MFVRVRSARPGAAQHEFDVPTVEVERHPDRYKVVDKKPVAKQRPASFVSGVRPEPPVEADAVDDRPAVKKPRRGANPKEN
jgi:hypothetical protein